MRFEFPGRAYPDCMRFDIASCCLDAGRVVGPRNALPEVPGYSHRLLLELIGIADRTRPGLFMSRQLARREAFRILRRNDSVTNHSV
jgi:hypothetical protein